MLDEKGKGRGVRISGDDRAVTVHMASPGFGVVSTACAAAICCLPVAICIGIGSDAFAIAAVMTCAAVPIGLIIFSSILASRAGVDFRLSEKGIERRGATAFGIGQSKLWPAPIVVYIAPLWNFDVSGSISGFDQYQVGFLKPPGVAIDEVMLDPDTAHTLVEAVRRLNTPSIRLDLRAMTPAKPSTLCACGYDLVGIGSRVCPECGAPISVNRFEVLQRMHFELQAEKAANQMRPAAVQESDKEQA